MMLVSPNISQGSKAEHPILLYLGYLHIAEVCYIGGNSETALPPLQACKLKCYESV